VVWKMTAASFGIVVGGSMAVVMPHFMVGLLISAPVLYTQGKRLRQLKHKAGGHRALLKSISKVDLSAQIVSAVGTKTVLLVLLVGNDFTDLLEGWNTSTEEIKCRIKALPVPDDIPISEGLRKAVEVHENIITDTPLELTTDLADALPDMVKDDFDVQGNPVWGDETPMRTIAVLGVAAAIPDMVGKAAVEDPVAKAVNKRQR
jgi:hypothetical protein